MWCANHRSGLCRLLTLAVVLGAAPSAAVAQEKPKTAAAKPSIYDKSADAHAQVEKAKVVAKHNDKHILVMFGFETCGWCHKLHELFASDKDIRKTLSYEYTLAMVDINAPGADALLKTCKAALSPEELQKGVGYPFLSVLDSDGKVLTAQRTDPLEEGDHHNPGRVQEFLTKWSVPAKDADVVLQAGLARASSEDKRVFLKFGAPWCGWCHKLDDWMAQPEVTSILDREFVTVKVDIDRMTHGKDMLTRFRKSEQGGIPWFVVLDSAGKPQGNADGPKGNIGCPFEPWEIDHFMSVIGKECRRIDADAQARLRGSLKENAERIQKEMDARRPATAAPAAAAR
jgi:thioredoxin-related protein